MNLIISLLTAYITVGFGVVWWVSRSSIDWTALANAYLQAAKWPVLAYTQWKARKP